MYSGILKGMGGKGGSNKEQKLQQKQQSNLPSDEIVDLKNSLFVFNKSMKKFIGSAQEVSTFSPREASKKLHAGLGEILDIIRTIIDKYPSLSTPEVFSSIQMLVLYIQGKNSSCRESNKCLPVEMTSPLLIAFRDSADCAVEINRLVNQLALYFSRSVSQYLIQLKESNKITKSTDKVQSRKETNKSSNSIFGIELEKHLIASRLEIPFLVSKCIKEIETHGLYVNGIYRVSAVKSKVNQLCEAFEKYGSKVNLSDINPNIIANVLKLYLRELPQPLFTFELYPEFIRVAKLYGTDSSEENKKRCADELRKILAKLPKCYYVVVAAVMQHLHRISAESTLNNMSAYNLAVIFGPTLLHCLRGNSDTGSKAALFDSVHQIRAIELMITWADTLF